MSRKRKQTGVKSIFNSVELTRPNSNLFDMSYGHTLSGRIGELMVVCQQETVPGDTWRIGGDCLVRFAPMITPCMAKFDAYIHYFYVPNRTIWPGWSDFISPKDPLVAPPAHPYFTPTTGLSADQVKHLDNMAVPPFAGGGGVNNDINALPFMAFQKIYDEYYRDENLITALNTQLANGSNAVGILATLRRRAFAHDMFTSSLPWTQKGTPVDLPLGDVTLDPSWSALPGSPVMRNPGMAPLAGALASTVVDIQAAGGTVAYDPAGTLNVTATTINDLRRAEAIQEMLELDARGGTRYNETIKAHFGEDIGDATIQRAEYIVGVKTPVVISEVLNTTGTTGQLPQGNMAGHGMAAGGGQLSQYHCSEHGWIIGVMSVIPQPVYMWGLPRWSSYNDRYDYYWPKLANIGEAAIANRELMAYTNNPDNAFGYNPQYYNLKAGQNRVSGTFFRGAGLPWHAGRNFSRLAAVPLNQQFVEVNYADFERIFAVGGGADHLFIEVWNKMFARRLMPVFGTPQL